MQSHLRQCTDNYVDVLAHQIPWGPCCHCGSLETLGHSQYPNYFTSATTTIRFTHSYCLLATQCHGLCHSIHTVIWSQNLMYIHVYIHASAYYLSLFHRTSTDAQTLLRMCIITCACSSLCQFDGSPSGEDPLDELLVIFGLFLSLLISHKVHSEFHGRNVQSIQQPRYNNMNTFHSASMHKCK